MLAKQSFQNIPLLIIDSGSNKDYFDAMCSLKYDVVEISAEEFNHGKTRQQGADFYPQTDVCIFLTQDAILANEDSIEKIIEVFSDDNVGCAYGRQIPHNDANIFASFAREFNYGNKSYIRKYSDRKEYGMKTAFISNSFAAYRYEALKEVEGFPMHTILSEDMYVAAKMLMQGWKIAYVADAEVYHSHNYTFWQEFNRYFDIGVFHAKETWIQDVYGRAEGEGYRFVKKEFQMILQKEADKLPEMLLRDGMKFLGYRLGLNEKMLPRCVKRVLSMNKRYWG